MHAPPSLVLVRHGQSFGNLTGDYSTSQHDNLTDTGWAQARRVATFWRQPFDHVVVSPLSRTRQTALPTLQRFGQKAQLWPDLAECCWQEPRHLPPSDPELPLVPAPLRDEEVPWFHVEGEVGTPAEHERWQDGLRRMKRAQARLDSLVREGRSVLVFSHGYAISKLVILLTGEGSVDEVYDLDNTSVTHLVPHEDRYRVEVFNRRV